MIQSVFGTAVTYGEEYYEVQDGHDGIDMVFMMDGNDF